jgi:hypothetical protein
VEQLKVKLTQLSQTTDRKSDPLVLQDFY